MYDLSHDVYDLSHDEADWLVTVLQQECTCPARVERIIQMFFYWTFSLSIDLHTHYIKDICTSTLQIATFLGEKKN